ncbi:hypothetical protein SCLCIDRAFT_230166 [Scleroderma citrinum Foug A]|uniref:FAM192A/Fyv6 N-terminal domain-containing protein n=1 Tax=Scleroderma citrinum Foug A TaxID=1036808 RepID=A0A0C3E348_9AGAM|nr:hypothetical protein SCLCIDRAFT_230166 [Scleroderma citrinum Foug A]
MEEGVPSVSVTGVASRFVSQSDIEAAKTRKEEQWRAAYARLGQEPPPQPVDDAYDGRSLAEKLAANRVAKQEEWEEQMKLSNQFRALEEDEITFLDSIRERQAEEERLRKAEDGAELSGFRKAVAARENAINNPPPVISQLTPPKKDAKKALKGVIVKRGAKAQPSTKVPSDYKTSDDHPETKRRKISS